VKYKQNNNAGERTNEIGALQAIVGYDAKNAFAQRNSFLVL